MSGPFLMQDQINSAPGNGDVEIKISQPKYRRNETVSLLVKNTSNRSIFFRKTLHDSLSHEGDVFFHQFTKKSTVSTHNAFAASIDKSEHNPAVAEIKPGAELTVTWTGATFSDTPASKAPTKQKALVSPGKYTVRLRYSFSATQEPRATQGLLGPILYTGESPVFTLE